jgi:hypothetical protein
MSEVDIAGDFQGTISVPSAESVAAGQTPDSVAPARIFAGASIFQILFSFAAMLGTCLVGRIFFSLRSFPVDPDLWWHIKIGEDILASHHWPTADAYSFTAAGQHWLANEWLGDVLLAVAYRAGGLRALGASFIIIGSLIALALYFFATLRCGNPKVGFLVSAVLLNLAVVSFNLRPQMLAYLFLVLALIILERFRQGKRAALWLLPALVLLWVNTHGSWIVGVAALGVYLAGGLRKISLGNLETRPWSTTDRRWLTIVFALCVLATLITPYGASIAKFPFQMASSAPATVTNIQEWQPMGFALLGDKLFLGLILGFLVWQIVVRVKLRLEEVVLFLLSAAMAFIHMRFLLVFVPFCAPLFAVMLASCVARYDRTKEIYLLNAAVMVAVLAVMIWYFPSQAAYARDVEAAFPVQAVNYLNSHSVPGPMYNTYNLGGYLLWARSPGNRVFIDGRTDLYERAGVFSDYMNLTGLKPGSLGILQKYNIQSCLLWRDEPLATILVAVPGWQKVYVDDKNVVFIRQ